jgi:hypothetical protein
MFTSASAARGDTNVLDFWAATEVVMGQMGPATLEQLRQSPELMQQYKDVQLQQHLAQEAARRGLTERLDVQRALHVARRNVLVTALREDLIRQIPPPTDSEVKNAYQKNRERWLVPAAYTMDVFSFGANDNVAREAAKKLETGRPVSDAELAALVNVQTQVLMRSGAWLTTNNMTEAIWKGLALMKEREVRLFPDGARTLVVRRGAFREPRLLTLQEAAPLIRNDILRERAERVWSNYLAEARSQIK